MPQSKGKGNGKGICTDNIDYVEKPVEFSYENESEDKKYCEWIVNGNKNYVPTHKIKTIKSLLPGLYTIHWDNKFDDWSFTRNNIALDELLELPNPIFHDIINDIKYFWKNPQLFKKYKYAYKRGILLYGEPGCGKTSITAQLSKIIKEHDGIIFSIKNYQDLESYIQAVPKIIKSIQPTTPILTIIEDLDGLAKHAETETLLLNVLDGFYQLDNVVYIGCTNYPENLKERVLNRPSRFDKRYYIGAPMANVRKFYFEHKIKKDDLEKLNISISYLTEKTEGLSLAHLGELIKSVFIFNKDIEATINELKGMCEFISSSKFKNNDKSKIGFSK